jgi:hypothetical protein
MVINKGELIMETRYLSALIKSKQKGPKTINHSGGISRLLAAAVINQGFRELLLTHPTEALDQGYCGEKFALDCNERNLILSIQARDLSDFALQILTYQEDKSPHSSEYWIPVTHSKVVLDA